MKKLLLSGITAVALMAGASAQAADLDISGQTGVARTPLAMALAPMQFAIAGDYVFSDVAQVPVRGAIGLPYGFEIAGGYNWIDAEVDTETWNLNAKWVFPEFTQGLGLAVGGHYNAQEIGGFSNDGQDLYGVATYAIPMGEGMSLPISAGVKWVSLTGDNDADGFKFFTSVLFKAPMWSVGGEYMSVDDDVDGPNIDGFYWFGGRFYLNPMITFQAGYMNNANWNEDTEFGDNIDDEGVFHLGMQFAFGGGK